MTRKAILTLLLAISAGGTAFAAQTASGQTTDTKEAKHEDSKEKPWVTAQSARAAFSARGTVTLQLGAGDATIVSEPGAREIVVTTEIKNPGKAKDIKTKINVTGDSALVKVTGPDNFRYKIVLPTALNLKVRMSAGDLSLSGVDGSLDLQLHAGDCNVYLGSAAENFGPIDLSVGAGDITGEPFAASKSGLFRHFHDHRMGKYRLHVHVGAGDLRVK
jgi:hypothetical protein